MHRHLKCFGFFALNLLGLINLSAQASAIETVFTLQAPNGQWVVRALTHATHCPTIQWDNQAPLPMSLRAAQATLLARPAVAAADKKPVVFDVTTCESTWPAHAKAATVEGTVVPAPPREIRRMLIVADTGCRMKAADQAFQDCNDPRQWPFAEVAQSAAKLQADLVVHIGDIHYRESPCPLGRASCANATWGYGWDAWRDDFFKPAAPLLASAPWLFVRGNHESCARAGQGWFRFLDALPLTTQRSCNDPADDVHGDFSEPFAAAIDTNTQFIVFDSSKTAWRPYAPTDPAFVKYQAQLKTVEQLVKQKPESFFINHHPLLAATPVKDPATFSAGGNEGLLSVFAAHSPERLFPPGVTLALHGHIHMFESLSFKSNHPASLVLGNSGSQNEMVPPKTIGPADRVYKNAVVNHYAASAEYGFATLDRVGDTQSGSWLLTEYNTQGQAVILCRIQAGKSVCNKTVAATAQ